MDDVHPQHALQLWVNARGWRWGRAARSWRTGRLTERTPQSWPGTVYASQRAVALDRGVLVCGHGEDLLLHKNDRAATVQASDLISDALTLNAMVNSDLRQVVAKLTPASTLL
jgi:hypothetical protein